MNKFITLFDKLIAEQKEFLKKDTLHKIITQQTEKDQTKSEQSKPYIEQMKQLFIRIGSQNGKGDEKRLAAGFDKNLKEKSVVLFFIYDKNANVLFRYVKLSIFNSDPQQYIIAIKNSEEHIKAKNATVGFTNEQKRRIRNYKPIICKAISIIQPEEYPNIAEVENTFNQHLAKKEILYINDKKEITYLTIDEFFTNYKTYYKNIKSIIDNKNTEDNKAAEDKEKTKKDEEFNNFIQQATDYKNSLDIGGLKTALNCPNEYDSLRLSKLYAYDCSGKIRLEIKHLQQIDKNLEYFGNVLNFTFKNNYPMHPAWYAFIFYSIFNDAQWDDIDKENKVRIIRVMLPAKNKAMQLTKKYQQFFNLSKFGSYDKWEKLMNISIRDDNETIVKDAITKYDI